MKKSEHDLDKIIFDASEKYNRTLDLSIKITDDFNSARRSDIEQLRNLLVQISVVSFAAIGFTIPVIGSSSALKNPELLLIGLIFLLFPSLGGLWYSAIIIENSIKKSLHGYKQNKEEIREAMSNQVFLMQNPDKYDDFVSKVNQFVSKLKDNGVNKISIRRDMVLYILLLLLTLGICFVFISLLPLGDNRQFKNNNKVYYRTNGYNR